MDDDEYTIRSGLRWEMEPVKLHDEEPEEEPEPEPEIVIRTRKKGKR